MMERVPQREALMERFFVFSERRARSCLEYIVHMKQVQEQTAVSEAHTLLVRALPKLLMSRPSGPAL